MKRILSLFLTTALAISSFSGIKASAADLGQSASAFSVGEINHYLNPTRHLPLEIDITVPAVKTNSVLLVALYTENTLTKIVPVSISSSTTLNTLEIPLHTEDNDGHPRTPDKIRLFTWDKGNIKPLAYASDNMLTADVVEKANGKMVRNVLDHILGLSNKKNIITFLEAQFNEDSDKIFALLDGMETCAQDAYDKKSTQLLTSEYGRRAYYDEINTVLTDLKADSVQLEELKNVYTSLSGMSDSRGKQSYDVINRLLDFLRIDKDELLGNK